MQPSRQAGPAQRSYRDRSRIRTQGSSQLQPAAKDAAIVAKRRWISNHGFQSQPPDGQRDGQDRDDLPVMVAMNDWPRQIGEKHQRRDWAASSRAQAIVDDEHEARFRHVRSVGSPGGPGIGSRFPPRRAGVRVGARVRRRGKSGLPAMVLAMTPSPWMIRPTARNRLGNQPARTPGGESPATSRPHSSLRPGAPVSRRYLVRPFR